MDLYNYTYPTELYHYGILGMRWGVRRYQNKDGSLTAAGKKRKRTYAEDIKSMSDQELRTKINRMNLEKRYMELVKKNPRLLSQLDIAGKGAGLADSSIKAERTRKAFSGKQDPALDAAGSLVGFSSKSIQSVSKIAKMFSDKKNYEAARKQVSKISDSDLKKIVDRMDLERQYSSIKAETANKGKITVGQVLGVANDIAGLTASGIMVGIAIKKLVDGKK